MIDMEKTLAWKTNQGYADCSETLEEHDKQVYNQAIEDLKNALLEDKFISKIYGICEKIVEILERCYK